MMRHLFHTCLVALLVGWNAPSFAAPVPAKNLVYKPTFVTADKSITAGTAFLCEYPGKGVLLITAQHLLGPAGGFPADLAWNNLNDTIKQTTAVSMDDTNVQLTSKRAVLIEGAHAIDKTGLENDLAVFELDSTNAPHGFKLAASAPDRGDQVWLYARQAGGQSLELFPATVVISAQTELRFLFDAKDIRLAGTSGAPVLNAAGEVVAINLGAYDRPGKQIGFGNPTVSIRNHLQHALKNKP